MIRGAVLIAAVVLGPAAPAAAQECATRSDEAAWGAQGVQLAAAVPDDEDLVRPFILSGATGGSLQYFYVAANDAYLRADRPRLLAVIADIQQHIDRHPDGAAVAPFLLARYRGRLAEPNIEPADPAILQSLIDLPGAPLPAALGWGDALLDGARRDWRELRWTALAALTEQSGDPRHAAQAAEEIGRVLQQGVRLLDDHHGYGALIADRFELLRVRALVAARVAGADVDDAAIGDAIFAIAARPGLECAALTFGKLHYYRSVYLLDKIENDDPWEGGDGMPLALVEPAELFEEALAANEMAAQGLRYELAPVLWGLNQMQRVRIIDAWRRKAGAGNVPDYWEGLGRGGQLACDVRSTLIALEQGLGEHAPSDFINAFAGYCPLSEPETQP